MKATAGITYEIDSHLSRAAYQEEGDYSPAKN